MFTRINYSDLNARQQESHNFQKVSAVLADYGYATMRLTDDWQNADFIAQHIDGTQFLKIQLKGRLTFTKKYWGKDLFVAFKGTAGWYIYPHDTLLQIVLEKSNIGNSESWQEKGIYHWPSVPGQYKEVLRPYLIAGS